MKYTLTTQQLSSVLADEVVILNHVKGFYYGLDNVGALVWEYLSNNTAITLDELVGHVKENYAVETETCKADVQELLDELLQEKLVEVIA